MIGAGVQNRQVGERKGSLAFLICVPQRSSAGPRLLLFTPQLTAETQRNAEIRGVHIRAPPILQIGGADQNRLL